MSLEATYAALKESVFAIADTIAIDEDRPQIEGLPPLPNIRATCFAVDKRGVFATAGHALRALHEMRRPDGTYPANVLAPVETKSRIGVVGAPIAAIREVRFASGEKPRDLSGLAPDVGFLFTALDGLPVVDLHESPLSTPEGRQVGVAGYPLGTSLVTYTGAPTHFSPALRSGIVAAHLAKGSSVPGLLLDLLNQEGSSGSPVFDANSGRVIGLHVRGTVEQRVPLRRGDGTTDIVEILAGLSLAIASSVLLEVAADLAVPDLERRDFDDVRNKVIEELERLPEGAPALTARRML